MMHIHTDQLWEFGGKIKPNAGFLSTVINPIESIDKLHHEKNGNDGVEQKESDQNQSASVAANTVTFESLFDALSMDQKLSYGFFRTVLSISKSAFPVVVSHLYQTMKQNKEYPQFETIDVKQSTFNKLARFAKSAQFESLIECKQQKSKVLIHAVHSKETAKYLILLLHQIEDTKFDAIIRWFDAQSDDANDDAIDSIESNEPNGSEQVTEQKESASGLSLEQRFKSWYDTEFKSPDDSNDNDHGIKLDADTMIRCLFGSWSLISECDRIEDAFARHLAATFSIILSDDSSADNGLGSMQVNRANADDIFQCQFLETLKQTVDPNQLPLSVSSAMDKKKMFILKPDFVFSKRNLLRVNLEEDVISSVKQTRWKKSSKFLKVPNKSVTLHMKTTMP